jgi:hypothetical protein
MGLMRFVRGCLGRRAVDKDVEQRQQSNRPHVIIVLYGNQPLHRFEQDKKKSSSPLITVATARS